MCTRSCGPREYNHGMLQSKSILVVASHVYILKGHMNEHTLLNNVMYSRVQFLLTRGLIGRSDIIEHKKLCLVNWYIFWQVKLQTIIVTKQNYTKYGI
jgi:hypothetical protein